MGVNSPAGTVRAVGSSARCERLAEFEQVYRANVGVVTGFFARRWSDPCAVADLTSDTFVRRSARSARSIRARAARAPGCSGSPGGALARLDEHGIVELDEERKAAMVSNLLVVLCADQPASPVVNTGTLYS